jgi:NitT/TauT family transport system ATP-binding protein
VTTETTRPAAFECSDLALRYGGAGGKTIFEGLDLTVDSGQFLTILGGSGVGKSTLLRILAGLAPPNQGSVSVLGRPVTGPPADVVMVFQDYSRSLLPWRTVLDNAKLGVEAGLTARDARVRAVEALEMVGLGQSMALHPWQMSGGMQQRLQIARALATKPSALLMDEPFGALDALTKSSLQDQLRALQVETGITILFVTHDVDEAIYLGDRCIVMSDRPARIIDDAEIRLGRERDQLHTRASDHFLELRERLRGGLYRTT